MAKLHLRPDKVKVKKSTKSAKAAADDPECLTNNAYAMSAKDGEYVEFDNDCLCAGQVEVWLNRLMATMRSTIRHNMTHAVKAYEEKPRYLLYSE